MSTEILLMLIINVGSSAQQCLREYAAGNKKQYKQ